MTQTAYQKETINEGDIHHRFVKDLGRDPVTKQGQIAGASTQAIVSEVKYKKWGKTGKKIQSRVRLAHFFGPMANVNASAFLQVMEEQQKYREKLVKFAKEKPEREARLKEIKRRIGV